MRLVPAIVEEESRRGRTLFSQCTQVIHRAVSCTRVGQAETGMSTRLRIAIATQQLCLPVSIDITCLRVALLQPVGRILQYRIDHDSQSQSRTLMQNFGDLFEIVEALSTVYEAPLREKLDGIEVQFTSNTLQLTYTN